MKDTLDLINKKITCAEEDYKRIESAWISAKEIKTRIESLLHLATELRASEEDVKRRKLSAPIDKRMIL